MSANYIGKKKKEKFSRDIGKQVINGMSIDGTPEYYLTTIDAFTYKYNRNTKELIEKNDEKTIRIDCELSSVPFHQETILYGCFVKGKKVNIDSRDLPPCLSFEEDLPSIDYVEYTHGKSRNNIDKETEWHFYSYLWNEYGENHSVNIITRIKIK